MSHYGVNAIVPKTLIQYLVPLGRRARATSARSARRRCSTHPRAPRSARSWCPRASGDGDEPDAAHRGRRRPLRAAGLLPVLRRCASATGRRRSRTWRYAPWRDRRRGAWPDVPADAPPRVRPRRDQAAGCACSCYRFFRPASSSGSACPTARRSAPAARCRRAATGARRATARPRRRGSPSSTPWSASSRRPAERRLEVVGGRVLRLVEHDRVGAGHVDEGREPEPPVGDRGRSKVAPLASSSARVASRSSHISESSWCRGRGVLAALPHGGGRVHAHLARAAPEDEPAPAGVRVLDVGHPSTSRRKARVAGGSSE